MDSSEANKLLELMQERKLTRTQSNYMPSRTPVEDATRGREFSFDGQDDSTQGQDTLKTTPQSISRSLMREALKSAKLQPKTELNAEISCLKNQIQLNRPENFDNFLSTLKKKMLIQREDADSFEDEQDFVFGLNKQDTLLSDTSDDPKTLLTQNPLLGSLESYVNETFNYLHKNSPTLDLQETTLLTKNSVAVL